MRGLSVDLNLKGLENEKGSRNTENTTYCLGAVQTSVGLQGFTPPITIFPTISGLALTPDWPFPQFFETDVGWFVGTRAGLYQLSVSANVWTATCITTNMTHDIDWPWSCADVPLYPVFSSGDLFVYFDTDADQWVTWNKTYSAELESGGKWNATWNAPISVCFFKGQVIAVGSRNHSGTPSESRIIRWSQIGSFDFLGETATTGRNTAGVTFLKGGDHSFAMKCLPLKDHVIVYGSEMSYALTPVTTPITTFKITELPIAVANPLAADGGEDFHIVVDRYGYLWMVGNDSPNSLVSKLDVKRLGYEDYFEEMQNGVDIASGTGLVGVVWDKNEQKYYISNGEVSYVLDPKSGLFNCDKVVHSVLPTFNKQATDVSDYDSITSQTVGYFSRLSDPEFWVRTAILDFGLSGIKTIETIDLGGEFEYAEEIEVMIEWRNDKTSTFRETSWVRCSPSGIASPIVSGVEFRINVRASLTQKVSLARLTVFYKMSDKRHVRGMYAGTSRSGANS